MTRIRPPMRAILVFSLALAVLATSCGGASQGPEAPVGEHHPTDRGWKLVWNDEFDADEIDLARWDHEENCWGGGNNEQQCYTDRPDNSFIEDGMLHITALDETFTGLAGHEDWDDADQLGTVTLPYTSARLRTKGMGDWTYGRFEIRARLPYGQGLWPAIWLLPTDSPYGGWAAGGEIDIMEAVNLKTARKPDTDSVHGTLHYGGEWPNNIYSGTFHQLADDHPSDVFHEYALEWEEGEIRWYVDDVHYATQRSSGWYSEVTTDEGGLSYPDDPAPFDQPFHLIMNVAVGGAWPGPPNRLTEFPQQMIVDWVRVYECSSSPEDGKGCATTDEDAAVVNGTPRPESMFDDALSGSFDPSELGDLMTVFDDEQVFPWRWDTWVGTGSLDVELVEVEGRGTVIQTTFDTNEAVIYFQSPTTHDLGDWATGTVAFDVRVLDPGLSSSLFMRVDCVFPCSSGNYLLGPTEGSDWVRYEVPIAELLTNTGSSLDLSLLNTPLVLLPSWGAQRGAVVQIDKVEWTR